MDEILPQHPGLLRVVNFRHDPLFGHFFESEFQKGLMEDAFPTNASETLMYRRTSRITLVTPQVRRGGSKHGRARVEVAVYRVHARGAQHRQHEPSRAHDRLRAVRFHGLLRPQVRAQRL